MDAASRVDNSAIDRWVQRSLRERYAATLREPIPDALTRLLLPETEQN